MDALSQVMQGLDIRAEVFFSGNLCGLQQFNEDEHQGMLHFIKTGKITVKTADGILLDACKSSVLFFPRGINHSIQVQESDNAQLVCASIQLPTQQRELISNALPNFLLIDADMGSDINSTTRWIFDEAFTQNPGHKLLIDRLCDVFMVQLLRHVVDVGIVNYGLIAGNSHPALLPVMEKLKSELQREWTVEEMAEYVAMSRSKFSALFKNIVGQAPMEYLTDLRLSLAKDLLKAGKPVGLIANEVGYENASTLSRVFKRRFGVTPKQWIKNYLL